MMESELTRRDAAWLMARVAGSALFASWLRAASDPHLHSHAPPDPHDWSKYRPQFFSADEFATLDAFTAILIPSDGSPGARDAFVAPFIDFVVQAASEFAPEMQTRWKEAVRLLVSQNFAQLPPAEQLALVRRMAAPEEDPSQKHPGFATYRLIKEMTVHAFYTSRPGLIDALEYQGLAYLTEFPACDHPEHHRV
jgi:hypothetical protein